MACGSLCGSTLLWRMPLCCPQGRRIWPCFSTRRCESIENRSLVWRRGSSVGNSTTRSECKVALF